MDSIRIDPSAKMGRCFEFEGEVTIGKNALVGDGVKISGKISVGDNCKIGHHIEITGAGYIGESSEIRHDIHNPRIGKNCIVKGEVSGSVLGDGCEIGENAQVERCNLGTGVKMKHFSGARDADIGDFTNLSEGVTIANYDGVEKKRTKIGAYVMIGVQTRIMGGAEIGDECFVADGARVDGNLTPRMYFNSEKALKHPELGVYRDNCSWYLYGNFLVLKKAVGPKYRAEFVNALINKHYGNTDEIKKWLKTPTQAFGGKTPIQCVKEGGCDAMEELCPDAAEAAKEARKLAAILKLKNAVADLVEDPEYWMNTEIPTGPFFRQTPKEVVETQGEKIIPLMVNFAKTKKIR